MAKKRTNNNTRVIRINGADYHRLMKLLEDEYDSTDVPFHIIIEKLIDEYE